MECYIIEEGVERKAELENLISLFGEVPALRYILRITDTQYIHLAAAIAHLSDEIKNKIYHSLSLRVGGSLKKEVKEVESEYEINSNYVQGQRTELINALGKFMKTNMWNYADRIILKDDETMEERPINPTPTPLEAFRKLNERAFESGKVMLWFSGTAEITQEDIQSTFQDRLNELHKIRSLKTNGRILHAAALLFEQGKIEELEIFGVDSKWPSFLEKYHALTTIVIRSYPGEDLTEFPSWIRNMTSLRILSIRDIKCPSLPDWIGDLQCLTELSLDWRLNSTSLPDGMKNLKNLEKLILDESTLEKLPDWIGELGALTELSLNGNKNIKTLPDSIGNLKKLKKLSLRDSSVETLPDSIVNCTALEFVDICKTKIRSVPDFISSVKTFKGNVPIELIPQEKSLSYRCFCNGYYRLAETLLQFSEKARKEGILALEDELDNFTAGFFHMGMRLVVDGTDGDVIKHILSTMLEREHDYYKKILMKTALEGILGIQIGNNPSRIAFQLVSLVNIKNNPLDAACAKYLAGDVEAFSNIDFKAAIQQEEEREEIRFIKRAMALSKILRNKGLLALEEHLDHAAIAARDVFEYGLPFIIDDFDYECIEKILSNLIEQESDPVQKNLAQAKKAAVLSLYNGDNPRVLLIILSAYFDKSITMNIGE